MDSKFTNKKTLYQFIVFKLNKHILQLTSINGNKYKEKKYHADKQFSDTK